MNKKPFLSALFINFLLYGMTLTVFGAALPEIIRSFNWNYTMAGGLLLSASIGFLTFSFVSGLIIKSLGMKKTIIITLLISAAAYFFFAKVPGLLFNYILSFIIGFGQGGSEVIVNFEVFRLGGQKDDSRLVNLLHAFFCVGAILAPIGFANLGAIGLDWKGLFPVFTVLLTIMAAVFSFFHFSDREESSEKSPGKQANLFKLILVVFFIVLFLYVGIELSVSNWASEYFVSTYKAPIEKASFIISLFWAGILAGRFSIFLFYKSSRPERLVFILTVASCIGFLALILSPNMALSAFFVFLIGLGFSGVYPLVVVLAGRVFKSPAAIGYVTAGGGAGSLAFPMIIAAIADRFTLRGSFTFCFIVNILLALLCFRILFSKDLKEKRA